MEVFDTPKGGQWTSPNIPPDTGFVVNWGNPYTAGLLFFGIPQPGGWFDLVTRRWMIPSGALNSANNFSYVQTALGGAWLIGSNGTGSVANFTMAGLPLVYGAASGKPAHVAAGFINSVAIDASNFTDIVGLGNQTIGLEIDVNTSGGALCTVISGGVSQNSTGGAVNGTGTSHCVVAGYNNSLSSDHTIYTSVDGAQTGNSTSTRDVSQLGGVFVGSTGHPAARAITWAAAWVGSIPLTNTAALKAFTNSANHYGQQAGIPVGFLRRMRRRGGMLT